MNILAGFVATTLLLLATGSIQAGEPTRSAPAGLGKHIMVAPADIVWGECPPFLPPGAKCAILEGDPQVPNALFTIRSKLPHNYRIPPHFHSSDEHVTVISGAFKMGLGKTFDQKAMRRMAAGSFMVMPKDAPHFALTQGDTIVQVHAIGPMTFTYINPVDDPRNR